ncbi:serine/threonine-protein kinase [Nocardia sp. CA-107356]|uniref:serine/threonine-protein kinase n=1 Tax=Nocardia sp. CA-107356 TaxID=3239972 RepID=UPI003D94BF59
MSVVEGAVFAGYQIERRLGAGGMGTVFLVQHPRLPRKDALKVLAEIHAEDPEFRARFLREAEIAARLQHPNLVAVRDRGEQDGRLWIAMQYVDGVDVAQLIKTNALPIERAVRIFVEAARGLDEIHQAGLLHRDVKPANILVAQQPDGSDRVLVTDFGIARAADDSTTLASGGTTATLAYAPPEQISGDPMDHRGDVYALGCTLYHMLTGSVPYPRDSPGAVMYAHLNEPPPRPSLENSSVPTAFDAVIAKAMAKQPDGRFSSCGAFAAAARAALDGGALTGSGPDAARTKRRDRLLAAGLLVVVVVASAISTVLWIGGDPPASTSPPSTTAGPPDVNTAEWGAYAYIAQAFPELLPPSPLATGYKDVGGCIPLDEQGRTASFDVPAAVGELFCIGDGDPARTMAVTCNANRSPIFPDRFFARVEGDERWVRSSGTGHVNWGSDIEIDGKIRGQLDVYFDDPSRNFCTVQVHGTGSGTELHDRWWPDAPL